jgi:hypothetical protein
LKGENPSINGLAMADSSRSARTCDVSLGSGGEERLPTGTPLNAKGNGGANSPVHGSVAPGCAQGPEALSPQAQPAAGARQGQNRRWGSTSVTGRLSWLEHNGHRVASPRPQHASKRHSGTYVGGSQLGSICHSAKPTTWPHRLMATAVVAVAQLPINGGLPTLPLAMHCHRPGRNHRP